MAKVLHRRCSSGGSLRALGFRPACLKFRVQTPPWFFYLLFIYFFFFLGGGGGGGGILGLRGLHRGVDSGNCCKSMLLSFLTCCSLNWPLPSHGLRESEDLRLACCGLGATGFLQQTILLGIDVPLQDSIHNPKLASRSS